MLPNKFREKLTPCINDDNWNGATEQMLNYGNLLEKVYAFYEKDYKKFEPPQEWLKDAVKKYGFFLPSQAIIGEVILYDVFDNMYDANNDFAEHGSTYFWMLKDAVLYNKPIINVIGRLRLWDFNITD